MTTRPARPAWREAWRCRLKRDRERRAWPTASFDWSRRRARWPRRAASRASPSLCWTPSRPCGGRSKYPPARPSRNSTRSSTRPWAGRTATCTLSASVTGPSASASESVRSCSSSTFGPYPSFNSGPPTTRSPKLKECKWQSSQPMAVLRNVWSCAKVEPAGTSICRHTAGSTFAQLHTFLNTAMGWEDYHLHEFGFGDRLVGGPELNDGNGPEVEDEQELALADALADGHRELVYTYDFGDEWRHVVRVDAVEDAAEGVFYPRCIDGARACPPEDVGGVYGYALFLDAMADPRHPEHEEQTLWYEEVCGSGAFDPDGFDAEVVSRLLRIAATGDLAAADLDFFDA